MEYRNSSSHTHNFFIQESGLITQTVKIIPLVQIKHHLYRIIMCAQIRRIMPFRLQNLFHLLTDFPANTSTLPVCPDKRSPVRSRNHHFQIFSKLHPDLIGCNYQIFSFLLCRQFCRNRLVSINGLRIMFLCSVRHKILTISSLMAFTTSFCCSYFTQISFPSCRKDIIFPAVLIVSPFRYSVSCVVVSGS